MYPIDWLTPCRPSEAPAGSLLLASETAAPLLRFDKDQIKLAIALDDVHPRPFIGMNIGDRHEPELIFEQWSVRADPQTAFSTFSGFPEKGQVFRLGDGTTGFVITLDHHTIYVTTAGAVIPEPGYNERAMFFRSWSIVVELDRDVIELASFDAEDRKP